MFGECEAFAVRIELNRRRKLANKIREARRNYLLALREVEKLEREFFQEFGRKVREND